MNHLLNPERWERVKDLYASLVELPTSQRTPWLEQHCPDDEVVRREVERLLAYQSGHQVSELAADIVGLRPRLGQFALGDLVAERFRIERFLGEGGMGEVWQATDTELHRQVALKTLHPTLAANPQVVDRFKREVMLASRITHPNICRIYDYGRHAEVSFLTMELVEGETLASRLEKQGRLTTDEALPLVAQICAGLAAAHAEGIVHRDFKSGNVMLSGDRAVVTDFGLARAVSADEGQDHTATGAILGTPAYMAPEQVVGDPVTAAADIYALGVVMYEMVTGHRPFEGGSAMALMARKVRDRPTPPGSLMTGLSVAWEAVIMRCLEAAPGDRFGSADEIPAALGAGNSVVWRERWRRWGRDSRPRRSSRRFIAAAATGLLLAGAGATWWWRAQQPSDEALRRYSQGVAALADGSHLRASRLFEAAIERDPSYALAHARRAQALAALDSPDLARESLLRAMELRNRILPVSSHERHTFDAIRATVTRDFSTAADRFAQAAAVAPSGERVLSLLDLGVAQEAAERPEVAAKTYQEVLALEPKHPTAYLRLGTLASRRADLAGSLSLFDDALRGYELLGNSEGIAETWIRRGQAYVRQSRFVEAREALEAGRQYAESNRLAAHQVRALFGLSNVALGSGDMEESRRLGEKALELARAEKQESQIIFAMNDLASAHLSQLKLKETEYLARQALELSERFRQPQSAARSRLLLMNTLYYSGGSETTAAARQLGNQSLAYYREVGDRRRQVDVLLMLGRLENKSDNFAAALPIFQAASEMGKALDDPQSIGLAQQGLAASSFALGNLPKSIEHSHLAVKAYRRSKRSGNLAYALMAEGEQRLELGQAEGDRLLQEASQLAAKNPRLVASIALIRADFQARQGNFVEAASLFRRASEFTEDESPGWRARLAASGARLAKDTGRRSALCRAALKLADDGLKFDIRASVLLSCGDSLRGDGRFLLLALTRLAQTAEAAGNHAVAWRAWQSVQAIQPASADAARASGVQWDELKLQWGEAVARSYSQTWTRPQLSSKGLTQ